MNYFAHASAAERYAKARPYFHPLVMDKIAARWPGRVPFGRALDVGCGTGMSAKALLQIAARVVGTDLSPEMLAQAEPGPRVEYLQAPAEQLPFPDASFDLVTSGLAFHWFDQTRFLAEAGRLLAPGAPLVVYGHGFAGVMPGNPAFARWHAETYLVRYPTPPRQSTDQSRQTLERTGWLRGAEAFRHALPLTADGLARYLMTQSNVIARVEQGGERPAEVYDWLCGQVRGFFRQEAEKFGFWGHVWHCRMP